ncbi:aluminum-activated malate transporter 9-like [Magnolia sinica]|uniref:aluminum-activated malate transporter 9-like n=1 Tax=Magnolia sinica TaxID=86752 RepID=UPI00265A4194|nr:aluminum-activated malate transporter 9-like [Magnolia sinica]
MALPKIGSFRYNFDMKNKERRASFRLYEENENREKIPFCRRLRDGIIHPWKGLQKFVTKVWEFGRSDPRNVIFSAKQGLALMIISLLVFFKGNLSRYAEWAVFTVVVVFEFSVGATFSKGINRGMGTLSAGGLALSIAELSKLAGKYEEIIIIFTIFFTGFWTTFVKLYPTMQQYEYGFRIFLLTYCLVMVSGNQNRQYIHTAVNRFFLIVVGAVVSVAVNVLIYPIWSGEDLHNSVVKNFTNVANSLEGSVNGYLRCVKYERIPSMILIYQAYDDPLYSGYRSAVQSKSKEDSLMGFAVWEPPHGPYRMLRYPWQKYLELSGALRYCAFVVMTMHGCMLSEIQAPAERRQVFSSEMQRVGIAGAKVLREIGNKVKKMEKLGSGDILFEVHQAAEELQKKIDKRSYLLVNSEAWEIGNRPVNVEDATDALDVMESNNQFLGTKSLSEAVLDLRPVSLSTRWDNRQPIMVLNSSIPPGGSPETLSRAQVPWSAWHSFNHGAIPEELSSRTYESASALSLATFASLLIEFVARLQNVVTTFEELSEKANFQEPVDGAAEEVVGFWTRLSRLLRFKD